MALMLVLIWRAVLCGGVLYNFIPHFCLLLLYNRVLIKPVLYTCSLL